ncbi:52 kDa repressor of the inhibitor of the protein kinase-like [Anthonomus grandis grandis]|uniref:52 kDa repressor of the inhibitor of the protein kinase-like n=1 Tax=Anthonomus grandis grandis TaxID=2921223 RepID=UPI002164F59A|nr:52 kDa repressor of the inhibitor of the protein kinase-like [Anthonomus grandis grandis]
MELYKYVVESLEDISAWRDSGDAPVLRNSLFDSDFLIALQVVNQSFSFGLPLCQVLQKVDINLKEAVMVTENEVASSVGAESKVKRITHKQKNRANPNINPNAENYAVDYFRTTMYLPFLEFFINQLEETFTSHKEIFQGFMCLLSPLSVGESTDSSNKFNNLLDLYVPDVSKIITKSEIKLWHEHLNNFPEIKNKRQALACLEVCSQHAYPNVHKLLKIFCTLPVSTSTPERTFSTLKRIKTYLRNTTTQTRLNGLAMLSIHREEVISVDEIIDDLALKPRRLDFVL